MSRVVVPAALCFSSDSSWRPSRSCRRPRILSIALELRSSRSEIDLLSPHAVGAYIDLSKATLGSHIYRVIADVPAGIEVANSTPRNVELRIRNRPTPESDVQAPPHEAPVARDPQRRR